MLRVGDYIGTPFVDGGRDPAAGLDCWGLVMAVMRQMGIEIPDYTISCFDSSAVGDQARQDMARCLEPVSQPEPGAIVLMSTDPEVPGAIQHFGVCIDSRRFIHTSERTGCIVTRVSDRFWVHRIKGFYRWKTA